MANSTKNVQNNVELNNFTHGQKGLPLISSYFLVTTFSVHLLCIIFSVLHAILKTLLVLASSRRLNSGFQISMGHMSYCHIHTKLQRLSCQLWRWVTSSKAGSVLLSPRSTSKHALVLLVLHPNHKELTPDTSSYALTLCERQCHPRSITLQHLTAW